jgi:hypothetical protein
MISNIDDAGISTMLCGCCNTAVNTAMVLTENLQVLLLLHVLLLSLVCVQVSLVSLCSGSGWRWIG